MISAMGAFFLRLVRLMGGLLLYALGIAVTLKANVGYAPWEVLHTGLANTLGISIGTASIGLGLIIILVTVYFKEKLGLGTILNMIFIGAFLDGILAWDGIPLADNFWLGLVMLMAGLYIIAMGTYLYIGSGFGAGPRDGLMVVLTRKSGVSVGICRGSIEVLAVVIGWLLGGLVGLGTLIAAIAVGFCVETTFRLFKFDATKVAHETLGETLALGWQRRPHQ